MMSDEEIDKFIEDQFQIFNQAAKDIKDNAIRFHREKCPNTDPRCENSFLGVFKMALEARITREEKTRIVNERRPN